MLPRHLPRPALPVILLAAACAGCGSAAGKPIDIAPVKGKVTYQGKPLTKGTVTFEPVGMGREASGDIQPDGTYALTTNKEGDGAAVGAHRVSVSGTGGPGRREAIPDKFTHLPTSKIEIEVAPGKTDYPIDLK